jgi:hypothetical protein
MMIIQARLRALFQKAIRKVKMAVAVLSLVICLPSPSQAGSIDCRSIIQKLLSAPAASCTYHGRAANGNWVPAVVQLAFDQSRGMVRWNLTVDSGNGGKQSASADILDLNSELFKSAKCAVDEKGVLQMAASTKQSDLHVEALNINAASDGKLLTFLYTTFSLDNGMTREQLTACK